MARTQPANGSLELSSDEGVCGKGGARPAITKKEADATGPLRRLGEEEGLQHDYWGRGIFKEEEKKGSSEPQQEPLEAYDAVNMNEEKGSLIERSVK